MEWRVVWYVLVGNGATLWLRSAVRRPTPSAGHAAVDVHLLLQLRAMR
jgi:hypothetical protein